MCLHFKSRIKVAYSVTFIVVCRTSLLVLSTILYMKGSDVSLGERLMILYATECLQVVEFYESKNPWREFPEVFVPRKLALVVYQVQSFSRRTLK